jgi:hypothetical protein
MSLRPVLVFFGLFGLAAAGYLLITASGGSVSLHGFNERSVDGPLFAIATAFVSILLLVMTRKPRTQLE